MNTVTMKKSDLLKVVKKNKKEHRALYLEAMESFVEKAISNLQSMLKRAEQGKVELYVNLIEPEDHTNDYDRVIEMLKYSVDSTIDLTSKEFESYVRDNWGWQNEFATTYHMNTGKFYKSDSGSL